MSKLDSIILNGFLLGVLFIAMGLYLLLGLWAFVMILGVVSLLMSYAAHVRQKEQETLQIASPDE